MATKPTISGLEVEYDATQLGGTYSDGDTITTWNDESGNANHATGVNSPKYESTGWAPDGGGAARLLKADTDYFTFDGSAFVGTNMTWFCVGEVGSEGLIFTGGSSLNLLSMVQLAVQSDFSVVADFIDTGPKHNTLVSAAGLANPGDIAVLSFRHSTTSGKMLRLNKVQVAANSAGDDNLDEFADPWLGRVRSILTDSRIAWISGYTTAASDAEIADMEAYLYERFSLPYPPAPLGARWFS